MGKSLAGVIAGVTLAALVTGCGEGKPPAAEAAESGALIEEALTTEVTYEVDGTATVVDLTLTDGSGSVSQQSNVDVPVKNKAGNVGLRMSMKSGTFAQISAQNKGDTGTVTCRIKSDGKIVDEVTSSGAYVIASCSGRV